MLCTHRAHLVLLGQSMQICKVYTQGTRRVKRTAHANMLCSHKHTLCYRDSPCKYALYTQARLMLQGQSMQILYALYTQARLILQGQSMQICSVHTSTTYVTWTVHTDKVCTHKHALCYRDSPCKYALYTQAHLML